MTSRWDERPDPIPEDATRVLGAPVNWNHVLDPLLGGTGLDSEANRTELAYLFRATFANWLLTVPDTKINMRTEVHNHHEVHHHHGSDDAHD